MEVTLVLVKPDGTSRDVPLKRARMTFGREKKCDVRIAVSSVSREHCEVRSEGNKLFVRDLGSSNGTFVNRARVQEVEIKAADLIAIGPAVFVVRVNGEPKKIDPRSAYSMGSGPKPVAAKAASQGARPSAPTGAKPKVASKDPGDSSVADFDFDFLDEEEDNKKKL